MQLFVYTGNNLFNIYSYSLTEAQASVGWADPRGMGESGSMDIFLNYLGRFGLNLLVVAFIVIVLYWRRKPSRTYALALIVGAEMVYIIITLMVNMEIGLGVGFGIFAIFSLLRFRTVSISPRDMTYLFVVFTLSLANALLMGLERWEEMLAINLAVLLTLLVLELGKFLPNRVSIKLVHDNLALLQPTERERLWQNVRERSGVTPSRITVEQVNLSSGLATLKVYFIEEDEPDNGYGAHDDTEDDDQI